MADTDGTQKMLPKTGMVDSKRARRPLCARTSYSCNKLLLFIYTSMFVLVGVFLMTAGLLVETRRAKLESLNNQLAIPVTLLLLVGLIICINAVCGAVGTVVENLTLLKVFEIITILSFFIQVAIGVFAFIYRTEVQSIIATHVMFAVRGYGNNTDYAKSMDYLHSQYQCCGLRSYADYSIENEMFKCNAGTPQACGVPNSCCRNNVTETPETCGFNSTGNLKVSEVYTNGCTDALVQWLIDDLDMTGTIALGFAIPQIVGLLLVFFFMRKVSFYQMGYRARQYLS